jgi:nucleoside-diphosphate-sugar epimerase
MTLKNKRVIITGGFGVIGRELIELLIDGGAHVQCFDRVPWPKDLIHLKNVISYHFGNIDEQNYKAAVSFDPHFVFHLAASFERSEESKEFWETNYRDNVQLSHVVLEASREMG